MKKRLITATDIRRLKETGELCVVVAKGDLVTPLALDAARELGVELRYEANGAADLPAWSGAAQRARREAAQTQAASATPTPVAPPDALEARVREIVTAMVAKCHTPAPVTPVRHITGRGLQLPPFPFDVGRPEMDVRLLDVVTSAHGSPMAGGIMSFRAGNFPWTLDYDEIDYVIEGELHIGTPQGTVIGLPGDVLYIPKGSSITFGTPQWTKFFYVTFPAEWGG
ncbi:MAG TPA: cupin domain-containing protein [Anaerolineae bacterium]|nr:cupin domain-containing protein [Anaerolineae bacterium]HRT30954.1 cupin domain-containing protein [Anaerolineae bacterium]HRU93612.1 cupin domain-containing protein [Anaerolineae bacterium]HXK42010.1 cupin domain-containing protein [Anaerolineae bacterium]